MAEKTRKFLSRGKILKRDGWSKEAIRELLGKPDKLKDNKDDTEKKTRLYLTKRVEEVEAAGNLKNFK